MNMASKFNLLTYVGVAALLVGGTAAAQDKAKMKTMKRADMAMHMMSADSTIASWPKSPK